MEVLTLPATLESLRSFTEFGYQAARQCGLDERAAWEAQLAIDEAVTNIIQHAYEGHSEGMISLCCTCQDNSFVVTLIDQGRSFDPDSVASPDITAPIDKRRPGGLGLFLMRQLMDQVEFQFDVQAGNKLTMVKRCGHPLPADVRIIPLSGPLDAATATQMGTLIRRAIADGGRRLVLDLTMVSFLSSSGLRVLLILARELKQLHGAMRLCSLPPPIAEVFNLTGFNRLFPIHQTREEALEAFSSASEKVQGADSSES